VIGRWLGLAVLCGACGGGAPEWAADGPPYEGVRIEIGAPEPAVLELKGAWLSDDGGGSGVDAHAVVPGAPPLDVRGARTTWDFRTSVMVFEGQVIATRGDVRLTCDRLEVSYAGDRIRTAVAAGAVEVSRGARVATGDAAVLTADDGKVVLTGHPRVSDGPNVLEGASITLFLDDERLECASCRLVVQGAAVAPLRP